MPREIMNIHENKCNSDINWILIFKTFSCYIYVTDRIFSLFILNSHLSIFMFDLILIFTKIQCEHFQRLFKKKTEFSNISFDLVIFQAPLSFIVQFKYLELLTNSHQLRCKWLKKRWLNLKRLLSFFFYSFIGLFHLHSR